MATVGEESKFWIDVSKAGPGLLSISVRGNHPFKINSSSDPANPTRIESNFCPTHSGDYIIDVKWSGEHIPGSPFTLTVTGGDGGVAVGGDLKETSSASGVDESLQEGVTFF